MTKKQKLWIITNESITPEMTAKEVTETVKRVKKMSKEKIESEISKIPIYQPI